VRGSYNCMCTLINSQAVEISLDLFGSSVLSVLFEGGKQYGKETEVKTG